MTLTYPHSVYGRETVRTLVPTLYTTVLKDKDKFTNQRIRIGPPFSFQRDFDVLRRHPFCLYYDPFVASLDNTT